MRVTYQILIGAGKKACEDSTLIYDRDHQYLLHEGYDSMDISEPCIIAVADGVGGNPGGREASTFSLSKLMEKFQDLKTPFNPDEISEKDRAFLWSYGLMQVDGFFKIIKEWDNEISYPGS